MSHKYLGSGQIEDRVQNPNKSHKGGSIIWKAVVSSFKVVEDCLVWRLAMGGSLELGKIHGHDVRINISSQSS